MANLLASQRVAKRVAWKGATAVVSKAALLAVDWAVLSVAATVDDSAVSKVSLSAVTLGAIQAALTAVQWVAYLAENLAARTAFLWAVRKDASLVVQLVDQ